MLHFFLSRIAILLVPIYLTFWSADNVVANLLNNGGFEAPVLAPGEFLAIGIGSEPSGFGWTVLAGNVDISNFPNPFVDFGVPEGAQGLDLNGTTSGTISQVFSTEIGQSYLLTFFYADNPIEFGVSSASVNISNEANGSILLSSTVEHSTSTNGSGATDDGVGDFLTFKGYFTAVGSTTRLTLTSTSTSSSPSGGILLDGVSVVEGLAGDFDFDGDVDGRDFLIWQRGGSPSPLSASDLNDWQTNYGVGALSAISTAVPEPSGGALILFVIVTSLDRFVIRKHL